MKTIGKTIITIAIIVASIGLVAFVLINNKKKNQEQTAIVSQNNASVGVRTDTVKEESVKVDFTANGNFEAAQELSFSAEKAGRVVRVLVDEGDRVHKGQTLATIRTDQLSVDLQNTRAAYQNARADKMRYENAYKTGGVTQQQLDQAKLSLANAEANLKQAQINAGDAHIKATINGIVNRRYVEPGSVLAPGSQLFDLVNVSTLKLKVNVDESEVAGLHIGDPIKVNASVYPGKDFTGKITFIAPKADNALNFPVELEIINNPKNELKAGMYGSATFHNPAQKPLSVIPRTAFLGSVSSNSVFIMDKNSMVHSRKVTPGRIIGDQVEVIAGLKQGEIVITSGQINLTDGSKVNMVK